MKNIKVEVEILLETNMNSINNGWDCTKQPELPYFHCEKRTNEKKIMKMYKTKENTLIHIQMYVYTQPWTYKHINIQIHLLT